MSPTVLTSKLQASLNKELLRRQLIRYFSERGFAEDFNKILHPPMLQDITMQIPMLNGKLEIAPYVEDIDPNSGVVTLGWNLFLLGNRRMFLGESTHSSLSEVAQFRGISMNSEKGTTTPKKVMNFVLTILEMDKRGLTQQPNIQGTKSPIPGTGMGDVTGYFFTKHKSVL